MSGAEEPQLFDDYADHYGGALARGVSISGESVEYFAKGRVAVVAQRLERLGIRADRCMDYGCGVGATGRFLSQLLGSRSLVGVDVSRASVGHAQRRAEYTTVSLPADLPAAGGFDVVYCNGVFHHIPPPERPGALRYIRESLRPGGVFAFWENNPWNPGTRLVMRRIPFDRNAVTVSYPEARRMISGAGFELVSSEFAFVFPGPLRALRFLEPMLSSLPIGAQYLVLSRRPA